MTSGSRAKAQRRAQAEQRSAALAALEARRRRRRRRWGVAAVAVVLVAVAIGIGLAVSRGSGTTSPPTAGSPRLHLGSLASLGTLQPAGSPGSPGPEGVPVPGGAALTGTAAGSAGSGGQPVDGITCQTNEQTLFHVHAHLTIFVGGVPSRVPYGIGIPGAQVSNTAEGPFVNAGNCFYWLHTHAEDGIIHIESPIERTFTLGDFFDIWGQPLGPDRVGPATGTVTALYDGKRYEGNPRDIPLEAHAQIQLEVGTPLVAPVSLARWNGL